MTTFATTPKPPYYIVAFSNQRTEGENGYGNMAKAMAELAAKQPGYLGIESVRDGNGFGITNSYWADEASIIAWKANVAHLAAQKQGREKWYEHFEVRIGKIERAYHL